MSTSAKIITGIVVVLAILAGIQYSQNPAVETAPAANTTETGTALSETAPVQVDSSDESLDKDLLLLEAELKASAGDSTAVDESLNDKPVAQES